MRYSVAHNIKLLATVLAISVFFLFCSANTLLAATMPAYERLQPVTANLNAPTAVALDARERIYVTEPSYNRLNVYSSSGKYLKRLSGLHKPLGVAVDSSGRIFVGNSNTGNVEVYDAEFTLLFKLGSGDGEFTKPCAIATDSAVNIYVADCEEDTIKVYNRDGSFSFSFGGYGSGDGQFSFPSSIAINKISGEIIISDHPLVSGMLGSYQGVRLQVFDMNGVFKRSFGVRGTGEGKLIKPMGVTVDGASRIYVTDSYQNVVEVFDNVGTYLGAVYDLNDPVRIPLGIALGNSNRLFIASHNTEKIEIYGIDAYTQMEVSPLSLSFEGYKGGTNPELQSVEIKNNGSEILNWTASTNESWITLSETFGSTGIGGISTINVGVDLTGLLAGTYTGSVEISAESGVTEVVNITLTVTSLPMLSVTPSSLEFTSVNGSIPPSQNLSIGNTGGGTLNWSASADSSWILLDKNSGTAPDTIIVSVDISSLGEGTYTGNITVTGEQGVLGSPVTVPVTLNIVVLKGTIKVFTNLEAATFTINGPESYSGSGTSWSVTDAPIGTYVIIYGDVEGYITPPSETQTLQENGAITFTGQYYEEGQPIPKSKNIIVGAGPGKYNSALVKVFNKVFNSDGTETGIEFIADAYKYGVNVASGDIDGDGIDEIITGAGPGAENPAEVNVFDRNGNQLAYLSITAHGYKYGVNVASGDFDSDGRYEIITGAGAGPTNPAEVKVFVYDPSKQELIDSGINLLAYATEYGVRIAAGDIDGDEIPEIITAPGPEESNTGIIKIWKVDTSLGTGQWSTSFYKEFTVASEYNYSISIASGDINGDGIDDIITGAGPHPRARDEIKIFDENGVSISEFRAYISRGYGVNVASGDIDADGVAEIIAGAGSGRRNRAIVKIFDAYGIEKAGFKALKTKYGVNVAVGNLGFEVTE